ncbi:MAG TPA: hypothetical protein VEG66_05660 [Thermoplasmata archaeon]|jgi:hypothetical protein|nr:hypothetical protein [Thermoplasmata archaeon]
MLSPESALVLSSRRAVTTWNAEQLRLYAALEGVDLVRLRAEAPAESSVGSIAASGPPAVSSPPTRGASVTPRVRSPTP